MTGNLQSGSGTDTLLARLATALGLPDATSEADLLSLVEKMVATLERLVPQQKPATAAELLQASVPDLARYVPVEAVQAMLHAANSERAEAKAARVLEKVTVALKEGHITPSLRDWAHALCASDEAAFDTFLERSGAPWAYLLKPSHMSARPPGTGLAAEHQRSLAAAVCAQLGLKPGTLSD